MKKLILYFAFAAGMAFAPSCEKEDDTAIKVYYASQPGYGGGTNPNPNGLPNTSGGTGTGPGTTTPICTNAMTVNGATCASVSAAGGVVSGTYKLVHSGSCIQVQITFPVGPLPATAFTRWWHRGLLATSVLLLTPPMASMPQEVLFR